MDNVKITVAGNVATITIDLSAPGTASASGKTVVIASTRGNATIPGTAFKLGLNVYRGRS